MESWHWLVGGLLLLVIELATPSGFFIMFFGLGALTVGVLMVAGLVSGTALEWLLFTGFSLMYLALFRRRVQQRLEQPPGAAIDSLVGDLAVPQQRIEIGAIGRVEVRGAGWTARNVGPAAVDAGQRCRVSAVSGLELAIVEEDSWKAA
jgi:membrane protein implicated in regulation of membrane protease activity